MNIYDVFVPSQIAKLDLQEATKLIDEYYGKEMIRVIRSLLKHKMLDTESLSKKTGYSINTVRRALYTLQKKGIVYLHRTEEKSYWILRTTNYEYILQKLLEDIKKKKEPKQKEGALFVCPACGREYTFDEAAEYDFVCPEDGVMLVAKQ